MSREIFTPDGTYSYEMFLQEVWSCVDYLTSKGVKAEDRVLLSMENSFSYMVTVFALIEMKCSIVLVDCLVNGEEVTRIALESKSKCSITDRLVPFSDDLIHITMPTHERGVSTKTDELSIEGWMTLKDALILYTSGSTGNPKGIVKSGKSFVSNIESTMKRMRYYREDVLLPLIPFTHFYGLSILFIWWLEKCDLVLCNYKDIRSIVKAIIDKKVTVVDGIPSTYYVFNRLLNKRSESLQSIKESNVRMWCVGGAPLSKKLSGEFERLMDKPLLDGYGLSEVGNVALNVESPRFGCGQPIDGVRLKVVRSDGQESEILEIGEVLVQSSGMMECYFENQEKTDEVNHDGWFKTNDLGYLDAQGNLFIVGRLGEEILRNGYLIYPASIEKEIEDRLGIKSKVISVEDEKKGAVLLLFVEAAEEEENQLKRLINQALNPILRPDKIIVLDEFPYLANGKIDQIQIKKWATHYSKGKERELWVT
jgi:long-chain acyl-CoA synthetase